MTPETPTTAAATWTQPLISIDVVPLRFQDSTAEVILGERVNAPFADELALPGVLMQHERSTDAAERALETKVGLDPKAAVYRDVGVFDAEDRDPRGPTLSIVKLAVVHSHPTLELASAKPLSQATGLPFDHDAIIRAAAGRLHQLLFNDQEATKAFFGEYFTTREAFRASEQLAECAGISKTMTISNLKRKIQDLDWVELTSRTSESSAKGGRPSFLWSWS